MARIQKLVPFGCVMTVQTIDYIMKYKGGKSDRQGTVFSHVH